MPRSWIPWRSPRRARDREEEGGGVSHFFPVMVVEFFFSSV